MAEIRPATRRRIAHVQESQRHRERERSQELTGSTDDSQTDFHDSTIRGLKESRANADTPATRRIFTEQIAIQEKRKAEAVALKQDSRRRNAPRIG